MTGVAGSPWYSNMYFRNDTNVDQSAGLTNRVRTFWDTCRNHMTFGLQMVVESEIPVIDERDGKMIGLHVGAGASVVGNGTGETLPTATQALVQWFTNGIVNGRKVRGRTFVPGMMEANNSGGLPTGTIDSALQTAANTLIATAPFLVVWSRPVSGEEPGTVARVGTAHNVLSSNVWAQWAVLRSRRD